MNPNNISECDRSSFEPNLIIQLIVLASYKYWIIKPQEHQVSVRFPEIVGTVD